MRPPAHLILFTLLLCAATTKTQAQASSPSKVPTGSISGRVTVNSVPAPGVIVVLQPSNSTSSQRPPDLKATTDEDGRYRLTGVAAGSYLLTAVAHTFFVPKDNLNGSQGKNISIAEGETVEGIDLALLPGGVITGRVTYASGAPLIGVEIELKQIIERGQKIPFSPSSDLRYFYKTDDRGIYRLYGVPTGRYTVSVAERRIGEQRFYPRTFHPGVNDEARATVIDVTARSETSNVDIKLPPPLQSYEVSGRFINAETGQPMAINASYSGIQTISDGRGKLTKNYEFGPGDNTTGEFNLKGLAPGSYAVKFNPGGASDFYSDPVALEVTDHDLSGLEIRVQRGASISGMAVLEGVSDPATLALLPQLRFTFYPLLPSSNTASGREFKVNSDGSFHIGGLPTSQVTFHVSPSSLETKGFLLVRIERNGMEISNNFRRGPDGNTIGGVEVKAGEQVTGVRLIIAHGTGAVHGQVNTIGGTLEEVSYLLISPRRITTSGQFIGLTSVGADARGQFIIDGLMAGTYEITLNYTLAAPRPGQPHSSATRQTITVNDGAVTPVTFTLDLTVKEKDK